MPTSISEPRASVDAARLSQQVRDLARAADFAEVRVTSASLSGVVGERLRAFIAEGRHGGMDWLAREPERRGSPDALWPEARSAILLGYSYAPEGDPLANLTSSERAVISRYARGRDYHDVMKAKLKDIARQFAELAQAAVKVFVDTAPVMEKPLAQAAGIGWQGKHTNLVSRDHGSWLFLGVILTTAVLEPDAPDVDHCGTCRRCLDVCPTQAFPAPYQLDARRCIAYLTIEHKDHIAPEFLGAIGNRVFGCDDCLAVCPWNKFAQVSREARFVGSSATDDPPLAELLVLDDAAFRARFAGTPIKRTGRDRFVRNVLIAAGNSGRAELLPFIEPLVGDASALVRAMAVRACRLLMAPGDYKVLRERASGGETDARVMAEWDAGSDR